MTHSNEPQFVDNLVDVENMPLPTEPQPLPERPNQRTETLPFPTQSPLGRTASEMNLAQYRTVQRRQALQPSQRELHRVPHPWTRQEPQEEGHFRYQDHRMDLQTIAQIGKPVTPADERRLWAMKFYFDDPPLTNGSGDFTTVWIANRIEYEQVGDRYVRVQRKYA